MARVERPNPPRKPRERRALRVLISGASGFIGSELVRQLEADGHEVLTLVRRAPRRPNEFTWSPSARILDAGVLDGVDAVVNLSGASTGRIPWTKGYKREILESRIAATQTIVTALSQATNPPSVFVNASAVGYYGDRPGARLVETSPKGDDFLAEVVERWEAAAALAPRKTRTVLARTGVVVGKGGAFIPLNLITRLGLGAKLGTGGQHWPWISLHDEAAAIRHLLTSKLSGPVNLVGPVPATSLRTTKALAKAMHRPHLWSIPEPLIRTGLGEAGTALLLTSQRVVPERLLADGFRFEHETIEQAIDAMIGSKD